jgi:hypothetical protein
MHMGDLPVNAGENLEERRPSGTNVLDKYN